MGLSSRFRLLSLCSAGFSLAMAVNNASALVPDGVARDPFLVSTDGDSVLGFEKFGPLGVTATGYIVGTIDDQHGTLTTGGFIGVGQSVPVRISGSYNRALLGWDNLAGSARAQNNDPEFDDFTQVSYPIPGSQCEFLEERLQRGLLVKSGATAVNNSGRAVGFVGSSSLGVVMIDGFCSTYFSRLEGEPRYLGRPVAGNFTDPNQFKGASWAYSTEASEDPLGVGTAAVTSNPSGAVGGPMMAEDDSEVELFSDINDQSHVVGWRGRRPSEGAPGSDFHGRIFRLDANGNVNQVQSLGGGSMNYLKPNAVTNVGSFSTIPTSRVFVVGQRQAGEARRAFGCMVNSADLTGCAAQNFQVGAGHNDSEARDVVLPLCEPKDAIAVGYSRTSYAAPKSPYLWRLNQSTGGSASSLVLPTNGPMSGDPDPDNFEAAEPRSVNKLGHVVGHGVLPESFGGTSLDRIHAVVWERSGTSGTSYPSVRRFRDISTLRVPNPEPSTAMSCGFEGEDEFTCVDTTCPISCAWSQLIAAYAIGDGNHVSGIGKKRGSADIYAFVITPINPPRTSCSKTIELSPGGSKVQPCRDC